MGYAKPTEARLIDQRARRRATQALIERHRDEFDTFYEMHRRAAEVEAGTLAEKAAEKHPTTEPPRLMPGARKPGQDVTERIAVARCRHCIRHHDKGHRCSNCGAAPTAPVSPYAVRTLAAEGATVQEIARRLNLTTITVHRVLDGRVASA